MIEALVGFVGTFLVFIGIFATLYLIIKGHEEYSKTSDLEDDGDAKYE